MYTLFYVKPFVSQTHSSRNGSGAGEVVWVQTGCYNKWGTTFYTGKQGHGEPT